MALSLIFGIPNGRFSALPGLGIITRLVAIAHEMLDRWLVWVDEAEPVPENTREDLANRDLWQCGTRSR
ncbi:hypothetical protein FDUTEX481_08581 [Tolypothrix sp. PCC 7601]|nr:hypothetical protein FDUTEX481_08581 [Tolypothrix sp. PCC 7601]